MYVEWDELFYVRLQCDISATSWSLCSHIVLMIQHANAHEKKTKNTQWTGKAWGLQNIGSTRASTTSTKTKHGWHTLTPLGPQKHIQFCTDPLPNSLALGIPQPIRFIWDPQNCTTYVYTDFALSPTNHHNQKQNMPLPSKMNKIHIKSLNSQHIEWKWYKSH